MQAPKQTAIRRRKTRTDDGKGVRRMIADRRFRAPAGIDVRGADQRSSRL